MNKKLLKIKIIIIISCTLAAIILGCALSRNIKSNDITDKCTHCHGEKLEGIHNAKAYCGECHDVSVLLSPENITDEDKKNALSEPHIHKIKNVYAGTPSCFYCHRNVDF